MQELVLWSLFLGHNLTDDSLHYTKNCVLSWCYTGKDDGTDDHLLLHDHLIFTLSGMHSLMPKSMLSSPKFEGG